METGSGTLVGLLDGLSAIDGEVFIGAAVRTGSHAVWHVDAVVAPPAEPPGWQPQVWEYDEVTFIAGQASSRALAAALDPGDAQVLSLDGYDLTFPVLHGQVPWQHKPSRARYDSVVLPWPTRIFEPWIQNRPGGERLPQGYVIGDDCPSFPSYQAAFRAFFYRDFAGTPGQVPSSFGVVRVVDSRAWLDKVRITPAALEVHVAGGDMTGARVELNSATHRTDARLTETGQVSLPLPDGLPPGAWLYLSREREWLDFRAIGEYRAAGDLARAGVDVEIAEDPESEIQALLAQGEGLQVEFKRQLPENTDESKRTVRAIGEAATRRSRTSGGTSQSPRRTPTGPTPGSGHPASAQMPSPRAGGSSASCAAAPGGPGSSPKPFTYCRSARHKQGGKASLCSGVPAIRR